MEEEEEDEEEEEEDEEEEEEEDEDEEMEKGVTKKGERGTIESPVGQREYRREEGSDRTAEL